MLRDAGGLGIAELSCNLKHLFILTGTRHLTTFTVKETHRCAIGHAGVNSTLNFFYQRNWNINAEVCVKCIFDMTIS